MSLPEKKIKKFLNHKISQLNDIIADFDNLLTEMETDFYRVTIFGSARIEQHSPLYQQIYELAAALAARDIDIVTGGGPGLMEAANKGAKAGSNRVRSIGLAIKLPFEDDANAHLDVKRHHRRFSSRLDEFMRISHAVIVTQGGLGTLLELFYTWQLMQVNHIQPRPFILLGKEMWKGLLKWMEKEVLGRKLMSNTDYFQLTLVDSIDEVIAILEPEVKKFYQFKEGQLPT
ncbi:MAG: LOG family protein [Oligoflexales bacterium]|nr:LOG family protein [Oligoflexales bacterium]